jgi:hypothetical protein
VTGQSSTRSLARAQGAADPPVEVKPALRVDVVAMFNSDGSVARYYGFHQNSVSIFDADGHLLWTEPIARRRRSWLRRLPQLRRRRSFIP